DARVEGTGPGHVVFRQAQDGIRESSVTGVQTCALPISWIDRYGEGTRPAARVPGAGFFVLHYPRKGLPQALLRRYRQGERQTPRSEERRVGKEWRAGGRADRD